MGTLICLLLLELYQSCLYTLSQIYRVSQKSNTWHSGDYSCKIEKKIWSFDSMNKLIIAWFTSTRSGGNTTSLLVFRYRLVEKDSGLCGWAWLSLVNLKGAISPSIIRFCLLLSNSTPICKPNSTSVGWSRSWLCFFLSQEEEEEQSGAELCQAQLAFAKLPTSLSSNQLRLAASYQLTFG